MTGTDESSAGRIVVGVDGSASSVAALHWAQRVGAALGCEIDAVAAWEYPMNYGLAGGVIDWRPDIDATTVLADTVSTAFGSSPPAGLRSVVTEGQPAGVLIAAGAGAEMLVVGSRGRGGFSGLLLGSVSTHCAEHARCPVVVVHSAPDAA